MMAVKGLAFEVKPYDRGDSLVVFDDQDSGRHAQSLTALERSQETSVAPLVVTFAIIDIFLTTKRTYESPQVRNNRVED